MSTETTPKEGGKAPTSMTPEEQKGVRALIYLQEMLGLTETEEQAIVGWRRMTQKEKDRTISAYRVVKGELEEEEKK